MLVVGEKEMNEGRLSVRKQGKGDTGTQPVDEFIAAIVEEFAERKAEN
jgi:threonyl-tRNA synthetase